MPDMKLRDLEIVRAVCAEGGFSGAARKLGLTQPTLSKAIAQLEEQIGARLFERGDGFARPTLLGQFVADRAEAVLLSMDSLERELREWVTGGSGKLRIGVGGATRIRPLPQILDFLAETYPAVAVDIRIGVGAAIAEGVARGRYDLAFSYSGNALDFGDLLRIKLFDADFCFVMRPGHPLADRATLTREEYLAYPMASLGVTPAMRQALGHVTEKQERNLTAFISDDIDTICRRVMKGDHLGKGPDFLFAEHVARGELIAKAVDDLPGYECWLLTTVDKWRMPVIQRIADMAKQLAWPAAP